MKLLGISGSIIGTKTAVVVKEVLKEVKKLDPQVEAEMLDLKNYDVQFSDGRKVSEYAGDTKKVIDKILNADFYIIGTPIFQASLAGALKNLFDLFPPATFAGKVMGFIATGGTYQHYLVIEHQLKPIASYFRAYVEPHHVYLHPDHFNNQNEIVDSEIIERINELAKGLLFMHKQLHIPEMSR
ncbi:NADPH-dependent FMN reductase [Domibacillus sp. DTU_2020_1001157_1_SI_ALB_TIR_016]|uniref:NADPH-dependent FMN reductase n=1 Tax=Domibacillus sp. DTU_2020_1001157_1_SI_ALB_TIR_016 TaxID=3077789 RepID=UPI0028EE7F02|nr:NADPH-dependent FMN reductase [Domibacillus sp. DTU_2020_1001157_1_SI_ALB_TIR_016]WNS79572.1 NADPH-dependent FMN reductase [Domibacillus sp. DTU_2020_1001157_1_SI_ALB_TIR_016]